MLLASGVLTAVPIRGARLYGAGAAEARLSLLAAAEACLGVPYRYAGIDRRGLDCSGLVYLSFREGCNYYAAPRTAEAIYNWTEKIDARELQIGDLVFFVTAGQRISHVGIYAGNGRFIHSASEGPRTGVMYSRLDEAYWKRTYRGAGRALPWDDEAAAAMASAVNKEKP
jgi:probable lipoprotein NlpC